jgi:DNA-binding transcriptional MocR family regulator
MNGTGSQNSTTGGGLFLYDRVARLVTGMIESGTLSPGDRVPSLRKMSKKLKVSIATVMQAYLNLEDQGLVESRPQSGFYVRNHPARSLSQPRKTTPRVQPRKVQLGDVVETIFTLSNEQGVVPLGVANPSTQLLPTKGLARAMNQVASRQPEAATKYCWPPGDYELRRQIAIRSSDIGPSITAQDVIITSGATEALSVSLQAIAKPGDIIAVESPTYFMLLQMIEKLGMLAVEIDTDPETGMCLDALGSALNAIDVKAVIQVGNFSNPLGSLMPDGDKKKMVELLAERNIPLIEDDIFGDLYFGDQRPRTCKAYDEKGLVLTCSSFSKTIAPGYRVGWVLPGKYYSPVVKAKLLASSATSSIGQLTISEFLHTGHYDRQLLRLRKTYRDQVDRMRYAVAEHFPVGTRITRPQGGFVLWAQLPRGIDSLELYQTALEHGVSITPGSLFSATQKYKNFIRLCAGQPWSNEIEQAVIKVGDLARRIGGKLAGGGSAGG